jgi:hypothetical protein
MTRTPVSSLIATCYRPFVPGQRNLLLQVRMDRDNKPGGRFAVTDVAGAPGGVAEYHRTFPTQAAALAYAVERGFSEILYEVPSVPGAAVETVSQ